MRPVEEGRVRANCVDLAFLSEGSGPLVLLMHGFPDDARTFSSQLPVLAGAGYRAVSAFMRGYPPSAGGAFYDQATLVEDAAALIDAIGGGEPAFVVGHDWGALVVYGLCAAYPQRVRRAVAMAVPHPGLGLQMISSYDQLKRSFYMLYFQIPFLPESTVDAAFIERLWSDWSPALHNPGQLANAQATLSEPGALANAIAYYRTLFDPKACDPALEATRAAMTRPVATPVMTMFGLDDGCIDPAFGEMADRFFAGTHERVMLPGCGHFLHLEKPAEVNEAILRWFAGR
jgi:pimeloyl-ACP methyl ester carboxylesterase